MNRSLATVVLVFGLVFGLCASVRADQPDGKADRAAQVDRGSLPESVRKAERQTGGAVLSAEPVQQDGRQVNRVKVLTNDGRVRVMEMEAEPRRGNTKSSSPPRSNQQASTNNKAEGDPEPF
jgi:hypothetical protein